MLKNFKIAKFKFTLKPEEKINIPLFFGATLRGGFGYAFKKIACIVRNKECRKCLLKEKCVYSYIFETSTPSDTKIMKKYIHPPQPFVIEPPTRDTSDREIEFGLVLIGRAIDYLPYFIYTFEELGKQGLGRNKIKFILSDVKCDISGNLIYNFSDKKLLQNYKVIRFEDLKIEDCKIKDKIKINFLIPARVKYNEKLISVPEFHILIRNLLRRISLLSYFHCDEELNIDFKDLIERAKNIKVENLNLKWCDYKRYSTRQKQKMKLGGFIGEITYEGNFSEFIKYLLLGEYVHIGKNCTFGLGKYELKI